MYTTQGACQRFTDIVEQDRNGFAVNEVTGKVVNAFINGITLHHSSSQVTVHPSHQQRIRRQPLQCGLGFLVCVSLPQTTLLRGCGLVCWDTCKLGGLRIGLHLTPQRRYNTKPYYICILDNR